MNFGDFLAATLIWLFVLFTVFSAALWYLGYRFRKQQSTILYVPETPEDSRVVCDSPVTLGIPFSEDVVITTADGLHLTGFIIWPGKPPTPRRGGEGSQTTTVPIGTSLNREDGAASSSTADAPHMTRQGGATSEPPSFFLVYFHGNAGNAGHRIPLAHAFAGRLRCAVMVVDYRGFGKSSDVDEITQEGLELDAQAVLDFAWNDPRVSREHIFVMGTSLGGAVAIHLAAKPENATRIAGVIIENTFTSISDMTSALGSDALHHFCAVAPEFAVCLLNYYFKPLILKLRWRSIALIDRLPQDLLFLSGQADELIPPTQMRRLYTTAKSGTHGNEGRSYTRGRPPLHRFAEFEEGHHNDLPMCQDYFSTIDRFIKDVYGSDSGFLPT